MKSRNGRIAVFVALMLLVVSGLAYLTLGKQPVKHEKKEARTLSVALVNEDEGTVFNRDFISFGSAFVKSVERDDSHEWYVVSRGVAENGLKKNTYNMMIVIPHDFSKKAVALDSDRPDPVTLPYKINATGSEASKVEAEKMAGDILNDFNKRVIDVYFASIIGNLQDAQQNVTKMVKKGEQYTNTYNQSIQMPLSGYTDQFQLVKGYTKSSKNSFGSFRKSMLSYGSGLKNSLSAAEGQMASLQAIDRDPYNLFGNAAYQDPLSIMDQLLLQNGELSPGGGNGLMQNQEQIRAFLKERREKVAELENKLRGMLDADLEKQVEERLAGSFDKAFEDEDMNLSVLFADPDKRARKTIERHIDKLPTLSPEKVDTTGLSDRTAARVKNAIAVTEQYNQQFDYDPHYSGGKLELPPEMIENIRHGLAETGLQVTDEVNIPENKNSGQYIKLIVPKGFSVSDFRVELPGGYQAITTGDAMNLPGNDAGRLKVQATLWLDDPNDKDLDIFKPAEWGWTLEQKDAGHDAGQEGAKAENMSYRYQTPLVKHLNAESDSKENAVDPAPAAGEEDKAEQDNIPADADPEQAEKPDADEKEKPETDQQKEEDDKETDKKPEKNEKPEVVTNNMIRHKVMTPLFDENADEFIKGVVDSMNEYEQLTSLFENYFGLNMEDPGLSEQLKDKKLADLASETSLYHLFNKEDIGNLLKGFVIGKILDDVTKQVKEPAEELAKEVAAYQELMNLADKDTDNMADKLTEAGEEAGSLNQDLASKMEEARTWREESLKQLDAEKSAERDHLSKLSGSFRDLFSSSAAIVMQSEHSLSSADSVYDTFARIDEQATKIQESGSGLVKKAGNLSKAMTDKILKDKEFAHNFKDVLANSKVGERPNEKLYDFLSNPVKTKNSGTIFANDDNSIHAAIPYYLVLLSFVTALFTAYAVSSLKGKWLKPNADQFDDGIVPLYRENGVITGLIAGFGLLEGLLIGVLSAYFLKVQASEAVWWTLYFMLMMLAMLAVSAYLLRQFKMGGMFILLAVFSVYLLFTDTLGGVRAGAESIRKYSPLQYLETLLEQLAAGNQGLVLYAVSLAAIAVAGLALNLFVRSWKKQVTSEDETSTQAG